MPRTGFWSSPTAQELDPLWAYTSAVAAETTDYGMQGTRNAEAISRIDQRYRDDFALLRDDLKQVRAELVKIREEQARVNQALAGILAELKK